MVLRPFLFAPGSCASYLFGCTTHDKLAVVDPHVDLIDEYIALAAAIASPIAAVFETHVQADHVSGLPALVEQTGATPYLPDGADVGFDHVPLADGDVVELGNTVVTAIATPGHAPAHHAYAVADRRRGTEEPWLVFTGDSLLIGDVGRPDLHVAGDAAGQARLLLEPAPPARAARSRRRLPEPLRRVGLRPKLSGNPISSIGFERRHNRMLAFSDAEEFVAELLADAPPPANQEEIIAANRSGRLAARA